MKKCKASELFSVKGNPQLNKDSFVFSENSQFPYFTRTVFNNGILGYVDYLDEEHKIDGNCLAVGMMGMKFFYMAHDFYAGQFTKSVYPEFEGFDDDIAQWFISWFNKSSDKYLSVLVRDFENVFNDTNIDVPYKNGKICISHIKNTVEELKRYETEKLNMFLDANGYSDCSLTDEEQQALASVATGKVPMIDKKLGLMFDIHPTKTYKGTNSTLFATKGRNPIVVNSSVDNGIGGRVALPPTERGNKITFSDTTTSDAIFYQPDDFIGYSHVQALYEKNHSWSQNELLYLLAAFKKNAKGRFDYATKFTRHLAADMDICLPANNDGSINYDLMESYVNALKKQCIARLKASDIFSRDKKNPKDLHKLKLYQLDGNKVSEEVSIMVAEEHLEDS